MADIEERIEQRIRAFADELRALIREAAHQAIDEHSVPRPRPPPTRVGRTRSPPRRRPASDHRRRERDAPPTTCSAISTRSATTSVGNPGATALEISAALGMAAHEITRPIKKVIVAGDARKTGVKSNTRCYSTDSPAPASAERHAGNSSPHLATR